MLWGAIKSTLNQTYRNIEIIILDNHSTDESKKYIYSKTTDKRIRWVRSDQDLTMLENWKRGFDFIKGDYFLRLDDDNLLFPNFIDKAMMEMSERKLDCVIFSPLISGNLNNLSLFFNLKESIHLLSPVELIYLEYYNMTDSNYALYKLASINKIADPKSLYTTTLPDRHLNYYMALGIYRHRLKVGITSSVMGLTRFDYKKTYSEDKFGYIDFTVLKSWRDIEKIDCHTDFNMHRLFTFKYFLSKNKRFKPLVSLLFTDDRLATNLLRLGYIYSFTYKAFKARDFLILFRYVIEIIGDYIKYYDLRLEGKGVIQNMASLFYNLLVRIRAEQKTGDLVLAEILVAEILKKKIPNTKIGNSPTLYGSLDRLLSSLPTNQQLHI